MDYIDSLQNHPDAPWNEQDLRCVACNAVLINIITITVWGDDYCETCAEDRANDDAEFAEEAGLPR